MTTESINGVLTLISAIEAWIAITAFLARIVKRDPLLISLMVGVAVIIAGTTYLVIRNPPPIVPVLIALIGSLVLAIVAWLLLASSGVTRLQVNITDPEDGGTVTRPDSGYLAKGTVSDPSARVHVLVSTLPSTDKWVQQPATVDGGGNWQATVYFGDKRISPREKYEAIALATNDNFLVTWATGNSLSQGQKLPSLPRKSNKSRLITVTRLK